MAKLSVQRAVALGQVGAKVAQLALVIGGKVFAASADGRLSAEEAEDLALAAVGEENIRVKIEGIDIVDDVAQDHFVRGLARVTQRLLSATVG